MLSGSLCLSPVYILSTYNINDTEKIGKSYLFVFGFIAGLDTKTFRKKLKNLFISRSQLVRAYKGKRKRDIEHPYSSPPLLINMNTPTLLPLY